ncbi:hypothetical protein OG790_00715 [Streptomyces cellulosae]
MAVVLVLAFGFVLTIASLVIWSVIRGMSRSWTGRHTPPGARRSHGVGGGPGAGAAGVRGPASAHGVGGDPTPPGWWAADSGGGSSTGSSGDTSASCGGGSSCGSPSSCGGGSSSSCGGGSSSSCGSSG